MKKVKKSQKSQHRCDVKRHQSRKHKTPNVEVIEHLLPIQIDEQPMNLNLMEDSIKVFRIFKLILNYNSTE